MEADKRERDEEPDDETVRRVLQKIESYNYASYLKKSREEKEELGLMGIAFLGKDLQKVIAGMEPGLLMTLAMKSRMFADLSASEFVWRNMFERHFPVDFAYCRGELPLFILHEKHPFRDILLIYENRPIIHSGPGWKRFYLHVRERYVIASGILIRTLPPFPPFSDIFRLAMSNLHQFIDLWGGHHGVISFGFYATFMRATRPRLLNGQDNLRHFVKITNDLDWFKKYYRGDNERTAINGDPNTLFTEEDEKRFITFMQTRPDNWKGFRQVKRNRQAFIQDMINVFKIHRRKYHHVCILSAENRFLDHKNFNFTKNATRIVMSDMMTTNIKGYLSDNPTQRLDMAHLPAELTYILFINPAFHTLETFQYDEVILDFELDFLRAIQTFTTHPRQFAGRGNKIFLIQSECTNCGITAPEMGACSLCKTQVYCGKACQQEDWSNHKKTCKQTK